MEDHTNNLRLMFSALGWLEIKKKVVHNGRPGTKV